MDSFYELSQDANRLRSNNMCLRPMVPDVSILMENSTKSAVQVHRRSDEHLSYNAWKCSPTTSNITSSSQNVNNTEQFLTPMQVSNSILRKQVRFQSPALQQQSMDSYIQENEMFDKNAIFGPSFRTKSDAANKISDFENIYLANIPNRKLDLSIIDSPVPEGKHVLSNFSKYSQLEKKLDTPVYDILNYKSPVGNKNKLESNCTSNKQFITRTSKDSPVGKTGRGLEDNLLNKTNNSFTDSSRIMKSNQNIHNSPYISNCRYQNTIRNCRDTRVHEQHCLYEQIPQVFGDINSPQNPSATSSTAIVLSNNSDNSDQPTVRDLLKIIQQQNEQLLILQKQVATLIDNQHTQQRTITNQPEIDKAINEPTTFQVFDQDKFRHKNPIVSNKFNIDVMTSFEVSIRPQQTVNGRPFDNGYQEAKIEEITEVFDSNMQFKDKMNHIDCYKGTGQGKSRMNDLSLMLSEPLQVQEGRISPDQSVHVDMIDYSSNSDSDSNDSSDLGWTIYNNVMGQVNNILTKANVAKIDQLNNQPNNNDKIRGKTMKKVEEATLRHLKSIGVHVPIEDSIDSLRTPNTDQGLAYSPTEVSFVVQQLLMKYLPSEHLAKFSHVPDDVQNDGHRATALRRNKSGPKINLVSRRPDFSFATVQYMKKYNLIANSVDDGNKIPTLQNINPVPQKFLDITALKQQPKLL